jgi:hypothetical protein
LIDKAARRKGRKKGMAKLTVRKLPFANTDKFYLALGYFFAAWSRTELAIDCAMWKARSGTETAEQAHERSARTKFSDKCKQFRTLLDGGKFPHGDKVKELLTQIEQGSMRNTFAHSFLASDADSVAFIHRKVEGKKYSVTGYKISPNEFIEHVQGFVRLSFEFEQAVGLSDREVHEFAAMAVPLKYDEP